MRLFVESPRRAQVQITSFRSAAALRGNLKEELLADRRLEDCQNRQNRREAFQSISRLCTAHWDGTVAGEINCRQACGGRRWRRTLHIGVVVDPRSVWVRRGAY